MAYSSPKVVTAHHLYVANRVGMSNGACPYHRLSEPRNFSHADLNRLPVALLGFTWRNKQSNFRCYVKWLYIDLKLQVNLEASRTKSVERLDHHVKQL